MVTSRRKFIKISALGLGGLAATSTAYKLFATNPILQASNKNNSSDKFIRSATYCEVCFWKCAAWTYTDTNGNIKKL
ncbi:anaerobic dehydrogenases [Jejuia pallidilutea]|uniref:Anaerobic dehydrogenases n=1 Tax=Jejuia pallidilutea TaxID=504487 RepID=A0A090W3R8_9FLAO|nr:anaerobic dehydrogenases [Jejuia pallidilutea]